MERKRDYLTGKKVGWNIGGNFLPLYTIIKFTNDGKKYYRQYDDNTGEWMETKSLLYGLSNGKLKIPELTPAVIFSICSGRQKTDVEKSFDRQLSRVENYGSIRR